ncbi:hypothetical protein OSH10_08305 [Kaistia defluvii]|uniref:hypothetical protein n=1 Tax=Kaistia defluvii TaxID=410841 RepID=UPI00225339DC|nr:hypothetical protein [Kaistia defluvii]MCX5518435.1 hypothetical protein [Kaistia defluvii]
METIRINEDLIEIGGKARVERGPAKKTGKATEKLLANDRTAAHYQLGVRDAAGNLIEAGKPMTYLDWLAPKGFYVYALVDESWVEDSFFGAADEAAAITRATEIAAA